MQPAYWQTMSSAFLMLFFISNLKARGINLVRRTNLLCVTKTEEIMMHIYLALFCQLMSITPPWAKGILRRLVCNYLSAYYKSKNIRSDVCYGVSALLMAECLSSQLLHRVRSPSSAQAEDDKSKIQCRCSMLKLIRDANHVTFYAGLPCSGTTNVVRAVAETRTRIIKIPCHKYRDRDKRAPEKGRSSCWNEGWRHCIKPWRFSLSRECQNARALGSKLNCCLMKTTTMACSDYYEQNLAVTRLRMSGYTYDVSESRWCTWTLRT